MTDDERDEFIQGIEDAGRKIGYRPHASRPWRRGWRLWHTREKYRRKYQAAA